MADLKIPCGGFNLNDKQFEIKSVDGKKTLCTKEKGRTQVQSDWNVNDSADPAFVKNRPFYTSDDIVDVAILPEASVEFRELGFPTPVGLHPTVMPFTLGTEYTVNFNGTLYNEKVAFDDRWNTAYLGDFGLAGGTPTPGAAPFLMLDAEPQIDVDGTLILTASINEGESATIGATKKEKEEIVVPLKYLPENLRNPVGRTESGTGEIFNLYTGIDKNVAGPYAHAEGYSCKATGESSHAANFATRAKGSGSTSIGYVTVAGSESQFVFGRYNEEDASSKYAAIFGNGNSAKHSNGHTLDWSGNAWYAGTVEGTAMIVKSSTPGSAKRFKISVDDSGAIKAEEIV